MVGGAWMQLDGTEEAGGVRGSIAKRAFRSRRVHFGIATAAVSSITGFILTVTQAHTVELGEFARFAVASAAYALVVGTVRATVSQPALALPSVDKATMSLICRRSTLCGLIAAIPVLTIGLILSDQYLLVTATSLPGLALYDSIRTVRLATSAPRAAFLQETAWGVASVAGCVIAFAGLAPGFASYACWMLSGSVIGICLTIGGRLPLLPAWLKGGVSTSTSLAFGGDYLVGGGAILLTTNVLAVFAGSDVVAALRAGGTLLGPASLLIGLLPTLLIPSLRIVHGNVSATRRLATKLGIMITAVGLPPLVLVAFFPPTWGRLVLADTWALAQPVLPFLALDSLAVLAMMVPFTGHRSLLAGRTSLVVRSSMALFRSVFTVWAGIAIGSVGAALAMAVSAVITAVVWWLSYFRRLRHAARLTSTPERTTGQL